jgi:hypothetical protein
MQHTNGVAVLATHLAHTDRRALSQAWYSALHLAGGAPRPRAAQTAPAKRGESIALLRAPHGARESLPRAGDEGARRGRSSMRAGAPRRDPSGVASERREPKTALTRRIAHALARRVPRGIPASFAVSAAHGRIHVLVRGDGAQTRVVAVCAPRLRERVERALAHARFALAERGIDAEAA